MENNEVQVIKKYMVDGVSVDSIDDYIRIKRLNTEFTEEDLLKRFRKAFVNKEGKIEENTDATPDDIVLKKWRDLPELTAGEILEKFQNVEQRAKVFQYFGAKRFFEEMSGRLIDTAIIPRKQPAWEIKGLNEGKPSPNTKINKKDITKKIVERDEVYELYKIDKKKLNENLSNSSIDVDLYILKMTCPSTGQEFFEFIDSDNSEAIKSAKDAARWQLTKDDGEGLTEKEFDNIEAES